MVLLINYRVTSLNGIGMRLKMDKIAFDFGPGFAFVEQQKNTPRIDGFKFDGGAFYSLVYTIDPRWQISHWATYRDNVAYPFDRLINGAVALTGKITKGIGLIVKVAYNYEGVLATGSIRTGFATRDYLTTTIGFTLHH
jgi:hypothetical protein